MDARSLVLEARKRLDDLDELRSLGLVSSTHQFFPSVHYPPITMYPGTTEEAFLRGWKNPVDGRFVLYVHIPFCPNRCFYCHYPVTTRFSDADQASYLELLEREMDLWLDRFGLRRFKAHSILVAGGTPTSLSPALFRRFHESFARRVDRDGCTQISYDVHPLTLLGPDGDERLRIMRDFGSERLTLGFQSMDEGLLRHMNRGHGLAEAHASIDQCRKAGYDDICIEFIYGYPGQTVESWLETVQAAIDADVEEIQLYRLKIVPYGDGPGPIEALYRTHPERFPPITEVLAMKQAAKLLLAEHGYHENLTRVFTRDPKLYSHYASDQCCRLLDCLGVGLSAFSSLHDRFSINTDSMEAYAGSIRAGRLPLNRGMIRDSDDQLRWHLILPLKNWWVVKAEYRQQTGHDVGAVFRRELDLLAAHDLVHEDDETIRLTSRGRFFADEVCTQLHRPRYMPFPRETYTEGPLYLSRELPVPAH